MIAVSLSLPHLLLYALLISGVLVWLNGRVVGTVASAGVLLAVCIVVAVVEALALGPATPTRQAIRLWLLFVCLPAAAVLAVSRLGFLNTRPWLLLLLGPISFVIALVVVTILHNLLIASPHSPVAPADDAGGPSGKTPRARAHLED